MSGGFRVLYVCTGNICRSAAAQQLLQDRLAPDDAVEVTSAGTHALEGHGLDAPTASALTAAGVTPTAHDARWLTAAMVDAADLVLGATTAHRDHVLGLVPGALRRTFTMREFARLGETVTGAASPADRDDVVAAVAGRRGRAERPAPGADDVGDPFGAGPEAARAMLAQVRPTVDETARLLGLVSAR